MNPTLSKAFNILRGPLALLVVYIHIDTNPVPLNMPQQNVESFLYNVIKLFVVQFSNLAVPCFFIISAYLLMYKNDEYLFVLKKKIKSLLLPYIIWNLLAAIYIKLTQGGNLFSFYDLFIRPANFPLWFLRDLIFLVIFSPAFRLLINQLKQFSLFLFIILYLMNAQEYLLFSINESTAIFFFFLGAYCGVLKYDFILSIKKVIIIAIITVVMYITSIIFYDNPHGFIQKLWLLAGSFSLISITNHLMKFVRLPNIFFKISDCSYFIYLSHKLGFTYIAKYPFSWLPQNEYMLIVRFLISPLLTIFLCFEVYQICNRYIKKTFLLLIGKSYTIK